METQKGRCLNEKGKWVSEKKEGLLRLVGRILRGWGERVKGRWEGLRWLKEVGRRHDKGSGGRGGREGLDGGYSRSIVHLPKKTGFGIDLKQK